MPWIRLSWSYRVSGLLLAGAAVISALVCTALVVMSVACGSAGEGPCGMMLMAALVDAALSAGLLASGITFLVASRRTPPEPEAPDVSTPSGPSLLDPLLQSLSEGVMTTAPDGTILSVNQALAEVLGYEPADILGKRPSMFCSHHHDDSFYAGMWQSLERDGRWEGRIMNRRRDGEAVAQRLTITATRNASGGNEGYVAVYEDAARSERLETTVPGVDWHDPLTGLANRTMFSDRLDVAVAHAGRNAETLAVVLLEIGRFAGINDTMGFIVGDRLLVKVSDILRGAIKDKDTLCRWRGPVFAILLPEMDKPERAALIARRILTALEHPLDVLEHKIYTSPSLGISVFPDDGKDGASLLRSADLALARAREQGKNRFRFYTLDFEKEASERLGLEVELGRAVKNSEFEIHYQPQMGIRSGKLVGAEALMRWRHPVKGLIPPGVFIPIAEDTGHILAMSEWLMWTGFEQWKRWSVDGRIDGARLSINISPLQFALPEFTDIVKDVLKQLKLDPRLVELEVTEGVLMKDTQNSIQKFQTLQEWGIHIALDDFGTGYSSLGYLTRFTVDTLKIDRSFIRNIPENQDNSAIVASIIAMAKKLDIALVAEGVEKQRQLDFLREHGCDTVQGYYFSRPVPPAEFLNVKDRKPPWS